MDKMTFAYSAGRKVRSYTLYVVALATCGVLACDSPSEPPKEDPPVVVPPIDSTGKTFPVFSNGAAQVVPGFSDGTKWIRQELWVESEFDSDGDGKRDRMHVDVTRPQQTETEGLKVPIVYASSPYYAGGANITNWNVMHEIGETPPPRTQAPPITFQPVRPTISTQEVSTWVPRGFAVVHSEAPGTGLSEGCPTMGGPIEALAPKAVIDWLNGRAKGYSTIGGTDTVSASKWSTGKVGMTGTSYDGTITLAAATTGVAGLEAIIPVSPNTSYYHYYRANGLVRHPGGYLGEDIDVLYEYVHSGDPAKRAYCNSTIRDAVLLANMDRITGDYNTMWAARDMLSGVSKIRAATLLAHGFNDWNVMPEHTVRVYEALKNTAAPRRVYFHQAGHGGPPPLDMRVRWFTRFLYGVQNGVESEQKSYVVRESANRDFPVAYSDYPNPAAVQVTLRPRAGGNGIGALGAGTAGQGIEKLTDDVAFTGAALAQASNSNNRLLYATDVLTAPAHISGWTKVTLRIAASKPAANVSVWLVALPWETANATFSLITRGWADPQNRAALNGLSTNYNAMSAGVPLTPGQFYDITFFLEPDDQVIPAGKRIGLMIMSSDREFTLWPRAGTELSIDLSGTSVTIPIVGGLSGLSGGVR